MPNAKSWILPLATALIMSAPLSAAGRRHRRRRRIFRLEFRKPAPVEDIPAPTADGPVTVAAPGSIAKTISLSDTDHAVASDDGGFTIAPAFGRDAADTNYFAWNMRARSPA